MPEAIYIPKHKGADSESPYDLLRAEGIAHVQDLARNRWTDYNEHDPGVTILEAFCFALTDVIYRAELPVPDFLLNAKGEIDWHRQGLLPAEDVLPCRPATELDYRAVILDRVQEVENLRFECVTEDGDPTGLYRVLLRLRPHTAGLGTMGPSLNRTSGGRLNAPDPERVVEEVRAVFSEVRGLCEDLESVEVVPTVDFDLQAQVEIAPGSDPTEVLARIYQKCSEFLAAGIEFQSYDLALREGTAPEEIFNGPFTRAGMVTGSVRKSKVGFSATEVYAQIKSIAGVVSVTVPAQPGAASSGLPLQLRWPKSDEEINVKIFRSGTRVKVSIHELNMRFEELNFANRGMRLGSNISEPIVPRPGGTPRNLRDYHSIQDELPPVYGVGRRGLPDSASLLRKVSARQLRGYLLLADQHVADLLEMLAQLSSMYSTELTRTRTYFFQQLGEKSFAGIEQTLQDGAAQAMENMCLWEDHNHRADRLIDYLLALYGEQYEDHPKLHTGIESDADKERAFQARKEFLKDIARVTRDRGSGRNYAKRPGGQENRAGLEIKLNHLLDFSAELKEHGGVRVMEHIFLRGPLEPYRITVLFPSWREEWRDARFRAKALEQLDANCPAHIYAEAFWVSHEEMQEFDGLHERWWKQKQTAEKAQSQLAKQPQPAGLSPRGRDAESSSALNRAADSIEGLPGRSTAEPAQTPHIPYAVRLLEEYAGELRGFLQRMRKEGRP